jgi:hypothetical protein
LLRTAKRDFTGAEAIARSNDVGRLNRYQGQLFYSFCLDEMVPVDHRARKNAVVLAGPAPLERLCGVRREARQESLEWQAGTHDTSFWKVSVETCEHAHECSRNIY